MPVCVFSFQRGVKKGWRQYGQIKYPSWVYAYWLKYDEVSRGREILKVMYNKRVCYQPG